MISKPIIHIFTSLPTNPMHVRLESNYKILKAKFEVKIFTTHDIDNKGKFLNLLFLNFFMINKILRFKKFISSADIIYIQTLYLLPLAIFAKIKGKKIIYETLDNHVHLKFYILTLSRPFIKWLKWFVIPMVSFIEKTLAFWFANTIIVNSKALQKYFRNKSQLLFYTSPLENLKLQNDSKNSPALIYLGMVSKEKGLFEMLELTDKLNIKLYVAGTLQSDSYMEEFNKRNITYLGHLSSDNMKIEIKNLLEKHFLLGISIIHPVHYSYKTQEANKDIDFLALGIPIIGNDRIPTKEKIDANCGVLYNNHKNVTELIEHQKIKKQTSMNCINYYREWYCYKNYKIKLLNIFNT